MTQALGISAKALLVIGLFLMLVGSCMGAAGAFEPVVVAEHGFEDLDDCGWVARGGMGWVHPTNAAARSGQGSLTIDGRQLDWHMARVELTEYMEKGVTYALELYVRLPEGVEPAPFTLTMLTRVDTVDTEDTLDADVTASSEEWVRLAGEYTMDPTTTGAYLYLYFNGDPTASYYIDDFKLTQLTAGPNAADAVSDSAQRLTFGFEGGTEGWGPRGSGVVVEAVKDAAHSGEYSLKATNRSAAWHGASIDLRDVLEKDVTYEISGYLRLTEKPTTTSTIRLTMEQKPVGESTGWITVAQTHVSNTEWVQLSGRYTHVEEMEQLNLYFESTNPADSFYIDNVSIFAPEAAVAAEAAAEGTEEMQEELEPAPLRVAADGVTVDLADTKQIIRGFGAASAWCGAISNRNMDILFKDMGLSILRMRIGPNENWRTMPDGSWASELSNAKKAIARGATTIIATPWTPPASMKTNNNVVDGSLKPSEYANYAEYLKSFADFFAENGAPLYAISIQNEPNIKVDYESCRWTSIEMRDFIRDHGATIAESTRIIMPEAFNFSFEMSDLTLMDEVASSYVSIIGGHLYGTTVRDYVYARYKGKEVWMTEHLVNDQSLSASLDTAKEIHDCMTIGNMNAYIWWWVISDANGFLDKQYRPQKRGYVVGQFAKFVRPGYYRVEATANPATDVYVTAYKGDGKVAIVAVNRSEWTVRQTFELQNGATAEMASWTTTATENIAEGPAYAVADGVFAADLPARSVTTLVGELM